MKRDKFNVAIDGVHYCTKYAWNSAKREVPNAVRSVLDDGETATEITADCVQREGRFVAGGFTYDTSKSRLITVTINKATT